MTSRDGDRAIDALRASEERFHGLIDAAPNGILLVDEDGRISSANARAREMFGGGPKEIVGRPVDDFLPDAIRPVRARDRAGHQAHPETRPMGGGRELLARRVDGSEFPVEIGLSSFVAGGRRLIAAMVLDVSAQKAAEQALAESERRFRTVLEAAPNAVVAVDGTGTITYVNPRVSTIFGYEPGELLDQPIETLLPEARRTDHVRHRTEFSVRPAARPMGIGLDLAGRRKDGTEFPVEISLSPVMTAGGLLVIATVADISGRKALEEQLLHAQKMEGIGRLAGGVAHDFNNVLTAITGYSSLLLSDLPPDSEHIASVEAIRDAADRATALTRQLLAFSRRQVLQPRVLDLNEVVRAIAPMLGPLLGERIRLAYRLAPEIGRLRADGTQIDQIILNLVVNARDAMPDGGTITIETANADFDEAYAIEHFEVSAGSYVMLAVSDTGLGMDRETREHIFEPFFTTKERGKGTGLGLATIYGVVRQSGGHIWLYSEPGTGTTFKIYFPRVDAPVDVVPRRVSTAPQGQGTILLVEDDEAVRQFTAYVLERHGYDVLPALDGQAALAVDPATEIDAMLTDVVMPGMSGLELARRLRESRPDLPVLFVSGYTEESLDAAGLRGEGLAFLSKPFSPDKLVEELERVIGTRSSASLRTRVSRPS